MNNIDQCGKTWYMPVEVDYCIVDTSTKKSIRNIKKWMDEFDPSKNHEVIDIKNSDSVYITNFGEVPKGYYLCFENKPKMITKVSVCPSYLFPSFIVDEFDPEHSYLYEEQKYLEVLQKMTARVKADIKKKKELDKQYAKNIKDKFSDF